MHPWIIEGWPITTYGFCIVCGLVAAWLLARRRARDDEIDPSWIDLMLPVMVGSGMIGAYGFGMWTDVVTEEASHGVVLVGAMVGATVGGIAFVLMARIALGRIGDLLAGPAAVAIACGRVGCFFAGCCYGKVAPAGLGIRFPRGSFAFADQVQQGALQADAAASLPVYPVQLMEAGACLLLAWALLGKGRRRGVPGERFLVLGMGYAVIRFPFEWLRADNPVVFGGMTFSQLATLWVFGAALVTLLMRRRLAETLQLRVQAGAPQ